MSRTRQNGAVGRVRPAVSKLATLPEHSFRREVRLGRYVLVPPLRLSRAGLAAAIVGPGLVTALAPITNLEGKAGPGLLYLLAVLLVTYVDGFWAGLLATGLAFLGYAYFFVPPIHSYDLEEGREGIVTGVIFVLVAIATVVAVERQRLLRRRTEDTADELAWGEARFRSLVEASAQIIWHANADGRDVGLSPMWLEFTGQSEAEARDQGWLACVHPDDRELVARRWAEAIEERHELEAECRMRGRGGVYRVMSVRGVPVRDERGQVREWVGVSTDVTEARRAEELLRARATQQLELAELSRLALASVQLDILLDEAVKVIAETLHGDAGLALELLSGEQELVLSAAHGWGEERVSQARTAVEGSWAKIALESEGPVVAEDLLADGRFRASRLLRETGAVSAAAVRIRRGQASWGVIEVLSRSPRRFTTDDATFLATIANVLAAAIERASREDALAFLADAGEVLQATLDYEHTLDEVAQLAVPRLADCCIVDVLGERREVEHLAVAHVDPEREGIVRRLETRYQSDVTLERSFAGSVLRDRRPRLVSVVDDLFLLEVAQDADHLAALRRLQLTSALSVPLIARGRPIGTITMICDVSGRRLGSHELALTTDLARHAALAVDNARLYQQRSHVASTLQRSLLPPELPRVPGVELAARYRAVGEGLEVGGDFYDAFPIEGGSYAIAIGDVCGKGVEAASVTGLTRHTIRASALRHRTPAVVLMELNEAVVREYEGATFCTVAYGVLDRQGPGTRLTLSSGGHPLPLVLRRHGQVATVGTFGTLLGIFPDPDFVETAVELGSGEVLLLYTDGLVDALGDQLESGEERLGELLRACKGLSAEELASRIEDAVVEIGAAADRDDIAFLVLRVV